MKKHCLLLLICFSSFTLSAQVGTSETDTELWLKAGAEVRLGDHWELALEEQLRFNNNIGEVKNYHTEFDLKYNLTKTLDLRFASRYIRRNRDSGYEERFRYQVGAGFKHELNRLEFKHRALFQNRNTLNVSEAEGDIPRHYFRWRSGLEYKIRDWKYDPIFRVEYFAATNGAKAGTDDSIRLSIGTERKYDGIGEFGIFYLYEHTVDAIDTEKTHILSLRYSYRF